MTTTTDKQPTSGDVPFANGKVFRWTLTGTTHPEIYGWVEDDHRLISGSGGYWRTTDPMKAARIAAGNFDTTVALEQAQ